MQQAMLTDALGYVAAGLVFATFCAQRMTSLRSLAIASNLAFIGYGYLDCLWPILVLHCAMLPINILRYRQSLRGPCGAATANTGAEQVSAPAPADAAELVVSVAEAPTLAVSAQAEELVQDIAGSQSPSEAAPKTEFAADEFIEVWRPTRHDEHARKPRHERGPRQRPPRRQPEAPPVAAAPAVAEATSAPEAEVEALFDVRGSDRLVAQLDAAGVARGTELVIRRVVQPSGVRSRLAVAARNS